jgi:hypothetical protein
MGVPPRETSNEWIRFLATKPTLQEIGDWIELKAIEIGWNDLDLSEYLFLAVQKPDHLLEPPPPAIVPS